MGPYARNNNMYKYNMFTQERTKGIFVHFVKTALTIERFWSFIYFPYSFPSSLINIFSWQSGYRYFGRLLCKVKRKNCIHYGLVLANVQSS